MSSAVVDVSGVGFELGISGSTAATLPTPGGEVRLYTRMQVREDAMTLFGFSSKDERTMFDRLVSVSGGQVLDTHILPIIPAQGNIGLLRAKAHGKECRTGIVDVPGDLGPELIRHGKVRYRDS